MFFGPPSMFFWLLVLVVLAVLFYIFLFTVKVQQPFMFEGAHVIVTGGSSGIGLELGMELARRGRINQPCPESLGSHVSIIARNVANLKSAHEKIERVKKTQVCRKFSLLTLSHKKSLGILVMSLRGRKSKKLLKLQLKKMAAESVRFFTTLFSLF